MRYLKRILLFISLFFLYIVIREFLQLYLLCRDLHPVVGILFLMLMAGILGFLVVIPILKIWRLPRNPAPVSITAKEPELIQRRMTIFRGNAYLKSVNFDFTGITDDREGYDRTVLVLSRRCEDIRRKYVSQLFYSSSISQSGFIDAILILSASVNMVREIFTLYNGRVANRDLYAIGRKVYYAVAIGGSGAVDYAVEEVISKLASESFRSIPFIDKILGSIADGYVNATLLARISFITENYCRMTLVTTPRDLSPSPEFITTTVRTITGDIIDLLHATMKKVSVDKARDFALFSLNPVKALFTKAADVISPGDQKLLSFIKECSMMPINQLGSGVNWFMRSFRRRDRLDSSSDQLR